MLIQSQVSLRWMLQTGNRTLALGFGSGLSPFAPGTLGTLWAWATFWLGNYFFSANDWAWIIALGFIFGCWLCGSVSKEIGQADFGGIVWDEIIAFWLILFFIMPTNYWMQTAAFVLFRFFDAVKPGPIHVVDGYFKKVPVVENPNFWQTLWHGFGIMIDDVVAAFFTLLVIALFQTLVP